jgi:hypothetical protein
LAIFSISRNAAPLAIGMFRIGQLLKPWVLPAESTQRPSSEQADPLAHGWVSGVSSPVDGLGTDSGPSLQQ